MVEAAVTLALAGWVLLTVSSSWYIYNRHKRETRAWLLLQAKSPKKEAKEQWVEFDLTRKSDFEARYHDYEPIGVMNE